MLQNDLPPSTRPQALSATCATPATSRHKPYPQDFMDSEDLFTKTYRKQTVRFQTVLNSNPVQANTKRSSHVHDRAHVNPSSLDRAHWVYK